MPPPPSKDLQIFHILYIIHYVTEVCLNPEGHKSIDEPVLGDT